MVRLITVPFALFVLYLSIQAYQTVQAEPNKNVTYEQPSIITVEELPPIREENE